MTWEVLIQPGGGGGSAGRAGSRGGICEGGEDKGIRMASGQTGVGALSYGLDGRGKVDRSVTIVKLCNGKYMRMTTCEEDQESR